MFLDANPIQVIKLEIFGDHFATLITKTVLSIVHSINVLF